MLLSAGSLVAGASLVFVSIEIIFKKKGDIETCLEFFDALDLNFNWDMILIDLFECVLFQSLSLSIRESLNWNNELFESDTT